MDATSSELRATQLTGDNPSPEKPGRLILYAFSWMLAALVASGMAAFTEAFINTGMGHRSGIPSYISYPTGIFATQAALLFAAIHRGRIIAGANRLAVTLGNVPLKRVWPVIPLGIVIGFWSGMFAWIRIIHPPPVPSAYAIDINSALATGGWITVVLIVFAVVVLAPVVEELFFRGWLWEGLRHSWRPVPVMLGTALPWLLMHALDIGIATVALVPGAVCFSVARHLCGSVRASAALHGLNNAIVIGASVWIFKGPV